MNVPAVEFEILNIAGILGGESGGGGGMRKIERSNRTATGMGFATPSRARKSKVLVEERFSIRETQVFTFPIYAIMY